MINSINVLKYFEVVEQDDVLYLLSELHGISLLSIINQLKVQNTMLSAEVIIDIALQLINAVYEL